MSVKKRVAIVGAGVSGLPAIRHALLNDLTPVCFELTNDIGGLWRYKEEDDRNVKGINVSSVMKSTTINTSKEMTAYSDFPPPAEIANYMHNSAMFQYLQDYAIHFDLRRHIRFGHRVDRIARSADYEQTGRWTVTFTNEKDEQCTEVFDAVLVATGHHAEPRWPKPFPGQRSFHEPITHSHDYTTAHGLEDKVVVVLGIGNSAGDLAVEVSRVAKQVYVATRRGAWVSCRLTKGGHPRDATLNTRKDLFLKKFRSLKQQNDLVQTRLEDAFDHVAYGLKPLHKPLNCHPTVNDELPGRLANQSIRIKPNIRSFTATNVTFEDGSTVESVDKVIFATGYRFGFPLIEDGKLIPVTDDNLADLYLNMFPPNLAHFHSLAVIGFVQPWGSTVPICEMQARFFYHAFVQNMTLPDEKGMWAAVEQQRRELRARYVDSPRHTIQVEFGPYMDTLADQMGCRPKMRWLWLMDPVLADALWNGPVTAYTYRLQGPHKWSGAREAILGTRRRIAVGLAPEGTDIPPSSEKCVAQCLWENVPNGTGLLLIGAVLGFSLYRSLRASNVGPF